MTAIGCYESDLPRLVGELPVSRKAALARGPLADPLCGVCEAIPIGVFRASPAARAVHEFHQADGKKGSAAYRRCVAVYRVDGQGRSARAARVRGRRRMKPYDPFEGLRKLERLATIAWVLCAIPFLLVGGLAVAALLIEGHV